jgi:hypothetical protein
MKDKPTEIYEDARGEAIEAIINKIGYGIDWETANKMIITLLSNWKN